MKGANARRLRTAVTARATKAKTNCVSGADSIAVDPADEAACTAIAKRQRRLKNLAENNAAEPDAAAEDTGVRAPTPKPKTPARIKRTAVDRVNEPPPATGMALVERVTQAVERELSQIEVIVGGHHVKKEQRTEAERRARTLASLARTLSEVRRLRADEEKLKPEDDDTVPRDLDEFRRTLSRRLEQMVRARSDVSAGGDEPG